MSKNVLIISSSPRKGSNARPCDDICRWQDDLQLSERKRHYRDVVNPGFYFYNRLFNE